MFKIKHLYNFIILLFSTIFILNCAGGGGGGGVVSSCTTSTSSYCTDEMNQQYGLVTTKAYAAYDRGYTGDGIKVAVFDGGFDTGHTDLDANLITGYDEEDDNNTPNADSHTAVVGGHGTHVAGIIAAEKNNSGMHGIAYNASIMPVKIFTDSGSMLSDISNSVAYAVDNGAIALNNSWGTSDFTSSATCTINGYVNQRCYGYIPGTSSSGFNGTSERTEWDDVATANAVAVFAAGNHGNNSATGEIKFYSSTSISSTFIGSYSPQVVKDAGLISYTNRSSYEARFGLIDSDISENWLNVVAVDKNNTIASFSNGCGDTKSYCIAAPGVEINSTLPTDLDSDGFGTISGTSMAAPHVSAAVAILKEEFPNLTGAQIVDLLLSSATDLGAGGTDEVYGVGLLNLDAATQSSGTMNIAMTNSSNSLEKLSLYKTNLNLSNIFNKNSINSSDFMGVVDSYDRVYSYKLNDFVQQSEKTKRDLLYSFNKNKQSSKSSVMMDEFNTVNFNTADNDKLINYETFYFKNLDNPYHDLISKDDNYLDIHNNFLNINFVVPRYTNNEDLDFAIYKDFNLVEKHPFSFGIVNEADDFLNSYGDGFFKNKSNTKTIYVDYEKIYNFEKFNLSTDFSAGQTYLRFKNSDYLSDTNISTSSYNIALNSKIHKNLTKYSIGLYQPLGVHDGHLNIKTISGYSSNGDYVNRSQSIDLESTENKLYFNAIKFSKKDSVLNLIADTDGDDSNISLLYEFNF